MRQEMLMAINHAHVLPLVAFAFHLLSVVFVCQPLSCLFLFLDGPSSERQVHSMKRREGWPVEMKTTQPTSNSRYLSTTPLSLLLRSSLLYIYIYIY